MPIDGHAHLVSQGWSGKGTGLRSGAITKPINIVQKKTLAGVGKDRDEAFPFWDHVFQAASVSIQVKVHNSDDESDSEGSSTPNLTLERTKTGIISNRRPTTGTPALSGATTPSEPQSLDDNGAVTLTPRSSIMAQAKQQSARRMLYAMFYRGPVLSTDDVEKAAPISASLPGPSSSSPAPAVKKPKEDTSKKRKAAPVGDEDKAERKRRKREAKEAEKRSKLTGKEKPTDDAEEQEGDDEDVEVPEVSKAVRKAERVERKRLKAVKRARKEERRKKRAARKAKEAEAASASNDKPTETGESASQEATPQAEAVMPLVERDAQNTSKRTGDLPEDTSSNDKITKKKKTKKS